MPPAAPPIPFTDQPSIEGLLSQYGVALAADDNQDGDVDTTEQARIDRAVGVGTATVLRYCQVRYDAADLVQSWSVWEWATCIAAVYLRRGRGNPVPEELIAYRDECVAALEHVKAETLNIEDIPERVSGGPRWSSISLDQRFTYRKLRVERPMGDGIQRERPVAADWPADIIAPIEQANGGGF